MDCKVRRSTQIRGGAIFGLAALGKAAAALEIAANLRIEGGNAAADVGQAAGQLIEQIART